MGLPCHPLRVLIFEFKEFWRRGLVVEEELEASLQTMVPLYISEHQSPLGTFHIITMKRKNHKSRMSARK